MAEYNGHRSKAAWNVSLWINNDERLYRLALDYNKKFKSKRRAALAMLREALPQRTPDGLKYTVRSVYEALCGFEE